MRSAVSASARAHDRSRGMEAGFFGYLTKPINVAEFLDSLDRALEAAQAPPAAAAAGSRAQ